MAKIEVLTTINKNKWREYLEGCSAKDPHYLPEYLEIYEEITNRETYLNFGGKGELFIYSDKNDFILYPYFKSMISDLPFVGTDLSDYKDIISPYGYGGPLACISNKNNIKDLWSGFFKSFSEYCGEEGIVSEFARLHPIFDNHNETIAFSTGMTEKNSRIIYVNLLKSESELWSGLNKSNRYYIRRNQKNTQLTFQSTGDFNKYPDFYGIYTDTMKRINAHGKYLFSKNFFRQAFKKLGNNLVYNNIMHDAKVIAGILILTYGGIAYYWLGGTDTNYLKLYPTNFLLYNTMLQLKNRGIHSFVLGGGLMDNDSLFKFKSSFSKLSKDFYIYKKIHNLEIYQVLCENRYKFDNFEEKNTEEPNFNYFPKYRA